jgi:hypothetical protein
MTQSPDSSPARTYLDLALKSFEKTAARSNASVSRQFAIAGKIIQFNIATGPMDRHISRGLAHIEVRASYNPDLTIYAWETESSDAEYLRPAWENDAYGFHGLISGFNDARFHTVMQFDPHILRLIDFERHEAIYWMPTARDMPVWERGAPARPLLHEWLRHQGLIPVHGGAVGTPAGGIFLAGAGGSGKSNLALSCLKSSPLFYASDDFCVLSKNPWAIHSLYNTAKIGAVDMVRHPHLKNLESNPTRLENEKALFFLHEHFAERLIKSLTLKAIVLPRVTRAPHSKLVEKSPAAAQRAIAMSTIQMSRSTAGFTFGSVAEFVRALPCYELQIGSDEGEGSRLLQNLLAALS